MLRHLTRVEYVRLTVPPRPAGSWTVIEISTARMASTAVIVEQHRVNLLLFGDLQFLGISNSENQLTTKISESGEID